MRFLETFRLRLGQRSKHLAYFRQQSLDPHAKDFWKIKHDVTVTGRHVSSGR